MTFNHNGFRVTVDSERPSVAAMLSLPQEQQWTDEQWVEPALQMIEAYILSVPTATIDEAIEYLNTGASWLWIGRDEEAVA